MSLSFKLFNRGFLFQKQSSFPLPRSWLYEKYQTTRYYYRWKTTIASALVEKELVVNDDGARTRLQEELDTKKLRTVETTSTRSVEKVDEDGSNVVKLAEELRSNEPATSISVKTADGGTKLAKLDDKNYEVVEKWWEDDDGEKRGTMTVEKKDADIAYVWLPKLQKYVKVENYSETWSGDPEKDIKKLMSQQPVKIITTDRESKINGAFLKIKKTDVDEMSLHYKELQEEEDKIPMYKKNPLFTSLSLCIALALLYTLKTEIEGA